MGGRVAVFLQTLLLILYLEKGERSTVRLEKRPQSRGPDREVGQHREHVCQHAVQFGGDRYFRYSGVGHHRKHKNEGGGHLYEEQ